MQHNLEYVAIEGPIGVGKTTLARRLARSLKAGLVVEEPAQNPFLADFYASPAAAALPTQLHFLMARRRAMRDMAASGRNGCWVSDFLWHKDRLFAEMTLNGNELELYNEISAELEFDLPVPDLVIYLQAPLNVLYKRIEKRGVSSEQSIASNYIARLQQSYTTFFHSYDQTPVLIVNATEIDFAESEQDYRLLLKQILTVQAGRHYFNPATESA